MLKDRKVLVEAEITKLTNIAAQMYLKDIISEQMYNNHIISKVSVSSEYQSIRERITDLQHERKMIQLLIDQGHE